MLRDRLTSDRQLLRQLTHRTRPARQPLEDRLAHRVAQNRQIHISESAHFRKSALSEAAKQEAAATDLPPTPERQPPWHTRIPSANPQCAEADFEFR